MPCRTVYSTVRTTTSFLFLAVSFAACSSGNATEQSPPAGGGQRGSGGGAPVPITTAVAVTKSVPLEIAAIGTAEPYSTVSVHAQITGQLTAVHFTEGDDVEAGQVLFELDRRPLEAALQQAQANLERDTAQSANAIAQAKRVQELSERGIVARDQLDQANASSTALQATVAADSAAIENAKVQLQYATIVAPLSGRTGALMVHAGNLVRANDTTPLVVINQVAPIFESFAIPESRLADLKHYMAQGGIKVEAQPTGGDLTASGRISFVDNQVDPTTGTIRIKAMFPNGDRSLWPGQFANIVVTLATDPRAVVVPTIAVQTGQQGQYVFVVKSDQTVEMRPVQIARAVGDQSIIASGVKVDETVVTDGQLRLVPGSRVAVKPAVAQ